MTSEALRRVALSSLQGTAVTAIKIDTYFMNFHLLMDKRRRYRYSVKY